MCAKSLCGAASINNYAWLCLHAGAHQLISIVVIMEFRLQVQIAGCPLDWARTVMV